MSADKITVLIVDDSAFMRNILERMIKRNPRFEIVGKAVDGADGVKLAQALKPDVITMDIEMPVMNGIEALEKIMATDPRPVIMVSSLTEAGATATIQSLEKGAVDFIPKALDSKDKNIFHIGDILHEKLAAAAGASLQAAVSKIVIGNNIDNLNAFSSKKTDPENQPVPQTSGAFSNQIPPATQPQSTTFPSSQATKGRLNNVKLLLIGSSTGGPRALQSVIPNLSENIGVPVVVAQHMPPNFTAAMARRLDDISALTVVEAQNNQVLEKNTVYISPGGLHTRINVINGKTVLSIAEDNGEGVLYHPSVDILSESAGKIFGSDILAVMLTGMGNDGAKEFSNLRKNGAYIIAQNQATCVVYGMPKCVVEHNAANEILPLEKIAPVIQRLLN